MWCRRPARSSRNSASAARAVRGRQAVLNIHRERMRVAEHAPRGPFRVLERRHGLAEIVERGTVVLVERPRVNPPHPERDLMTLSENASRHGHHFAQQCLGFFEAL